MSVPFVQKMRCWSRFDVGPACASSCVRQAARFVESVSALAMRANSLAKRTPRSVVFVSVPVPPVNGVAPPVSAVPPVSVIVMPAASFWLGSMMPMWRFPRAPLLFTVTVTTPRELDAVKGHRESAFTAAAMAAAMVVSVSEMLKAPV